MNDPTIETSIPPRIPQPSSFATPEAWVAAVHAQTPSLSVMLSPYVRKPTPAVSLVMLLLLHDDGAPDAEVIHIWNRSGEDLTPALRKRLRARLPDGQAFLRTAVVVGLDGAKQLARLGMTL